MVSDAMRAIGMCATRDDDPPTRREGHATGDNRTRIMLRK